jgi:hypothetical protein
MIGRREATMAALAALLPVSARAQAVWPTGRFAWSCPTDRAVRPTRWRGSMASG